MMRDDQSFWGAVSPEIEDEPPAQTEWSLLDLVLVATVTGTLLTVALGVIALVGAG